MNFNCIKSDNKWNFFFAFHPFCGALNLFFYFSNSKTKNDCGSLNILLTFFSSTYAKWILELCQFLAFLLGLLVIWLKSFSEKFSQFKGKNGQIIEENGCLFMYQFEEYVSSESIVLKSQFYWLDFENGQNLWKFDEYITF